MPQPAAVASSARGKSKRRSTRRAYGAAPALMPRGSRLDITGEIEGDFSGRAITVHLGASVVGSLGARSVIVHGLVRGTIQAGTIALGKTARVEGELHYRTLSVDQGAEVEARLIPEAEALRRRPQ
jgi:cytoskeletal protein CcmA (bactofilin family)